MRYPIKVIAVTLSVVAMSTMLDASELKGGYLNSATREAMMAVEDHHVSIYLYNNPLPLQFGDTRQSHVGKLWTVNSRGQASEVRGRFIDRLGRSIMSPRSVYDKVVYLNRYGNIFAAAGLDPQEILSLLPRDQHQNALLIMDAQKRPLFGAMRYSAPVLSQMQGSAGDVTSTFIMSMGWMGGSEIKQFAQQLVELAQLHQGFSITEVRKQLDVQSSVSTTKSVAPGVSLVAQGGNGSGGSNPIAQGGNGSGGSNPIAQGGNGSGGSNPIAQGGNGSGGSNPIAQGGNGSGGSNPIAQGGNGSGGSNPIAQAALAQMAKWSETGTGVDIEISGGSDVSLSALPRARNLNALTHGMVLILK